MNVTECRTKYGEAHDAHMRLNGECPWCGTVDPEQVDPSMVLCPTCGNPDCTLHERLTLSMSRKYARQYPRHVYHALVGENSVLMMHTLCGRMAYQQSTYGDPIPADLGNVTCPECRRLLANR